MIRFEWDDEKNRSNLRKHGISFNEAQTVFADEHAQLIADPDHTDKEDRFVLLGLSRTGNELVVCHCYRESEEVVRLISARKASKKEQRLYWEGTL